MADEEKVLDLIALMGEHLLLNGAEIARVQETMTIAAKAFGKENIDVYAVSNGIFVTMNHNRQTRHTQVKYVPLSSPNLGKVAAINQLSRGICEGKYTVERALRRMRAIAAMPGASLGVQLAACAVGSGSFCYLFGGSLVDSLCTVPVGVILCLFQYMMGRAKISKMMQTIFSSAIVTLMGMLVALLCRPFLPQIDMDKIIIGGLIILVPGMPFTTSIRDFFNGDYLSGTIRLIDALLVAVCMAIGVGIVYTLVY